MAYATERTGSSMQLRNWLYVAAIAAVALVMVLGVLVSDGALDFDYGTAALEPGSPESISGGAAAHIQEASAFGESVAPAAEIMPPHLVESTLLDG